MSKESQITVTFLGTGTSHGVPVIGCNCKVCKSDNMQNHRLRSSILLHDNHTNTTVIVDTSMDFRCQMLKHTPPKIDAVLYTHEHRDHTGGFDDLRPFIYMQNKPMKIFCTEHVKEQVISNFAYAFRSQNDLATPQVEFEIFDDKLFSVNGLEVQPLAGQHFKIPVTGFRFGKVAYITDFKEMPDSTIELLKGVEVLIINALRRERSVSHFSLDEALNVIAIVKPQKAYLTHMSHQIGLIDELNAELPEGIFAAYDGLELHI